MNKLRLICYFALLIVFCDCVEYCCAPHVAWPDHMKSIFNRAGNVEPREIMKVDVQNISFEKGGELVKSYAGESLTLIVNEHVVERDSSPTRVYCHFDIRLTNSDSRSESILSFWNMQIRSFAYFVSTGSRVKLTLVSEVTKGIVTLDFLNPGDAQLFWYHASKTRNRSKDHMVDVLKFEIFDRQTKRKIEQSSFAVMYKDLSKKAATTYTISLESDGVMQKPLLIFTSGYYSVSNMVEDRLGLLVSDEPNLVFVLQFAPFEIDQAVEFRHEMFLRRCSTLDPISDDELRTFINN